MKQLNLLDLVILQKRGFVRGFCAGPIIFRLGNHPHNQ